jgi:small subunit ribosomal protein S8
MTTTDPIADMITRIRNGQHARLSRVHCPASKERVNVLEVLKTEGYIRDYSVEEKEGNKKDITIDLKYHDGEPVITEITRVSKSGRRMYMQKRALPRVHNGLGISIVSTSHGIMSDQQARLANVGGEVLCTVF